MSYLINYNILTRQTSFWSSVPFTGEKCPNVKLKCLRRYLPLSYDASSIINGDDNCFSVPFILSGSLRHPRNNVKKKESLFQSVASFRNLRRRWSASSTGPVITLNRSSKIRLLLSFVRETVRILRIYWAGTTFRCTVVPCTTRWNLLVLNVSSGSCGGSTHPDIIEETIIDPASVFDRSSI